MSGLTENGTNNIISSTTYGPAGEVTAMSGTWGSESRSYNAMKQMTYMSSGSLSIGYNYSSTQNNGKITSQQDYVSGETVTYAYDTLNRLATAGTSAWGQSYAYDGFGNLTDITSTLGTTPEWHTPYSAATNRAAADCADANGNIEIIGTGCSALSAYSYDVENWIIFSGVGTVPAVEYAYAPDNKRVWRGMFSSGSRTTDEVTFWSVTGQRVGIYDLVSYSGSLWAVTPTGTGTGTEYYFGGKLVKNVSGYVHADRLGSIGKYYPYGQERPSATANGTEKFATYFRDSDTGLDYADQRYHAPGQGRFLSPDPSIDNVHFTDPLSWNAYAYANGDPINLSDPSGLQTCGQLPIVSGVFAGQTVSDVMTGTSGYDLLSQIIWHEGGVINSSDLASSTAKAAYGQDLAAVGSAVLNQYDVDNGRLNVIQNGRPVCPLGQCMNRTLQQIIIAIATYTNASGTLVSVFDSSGHMIDAQASALTGVLNTDITTGPQVMDSTGILVNQACEGVITSVVTASNLIGGSRRVSPNGLTLLFWNQAPANSTTTFPGDQGYTGWRDARTNGETFWGLPSTPTPPARFKSTR